MDEIQNYAPSGRSWRLQSKALETTEKFIKLTKKKHTHTKNNVVKLFLLHFISQV